MSKTITLCAALMTLAMLGSSFAQTAEKPTDVESLASIESWLTGSFDLPASHDLPRVELVPASRLAALRYKGLLSERAASVAADQAASGQNQIMALYDDAKRTIYLREGWTGATPAELSVLVHEMVHHMQNAAGLKYACPQAREKLAYATQERWLNLVGSSLMNEFEIDPMTILVQTNCLG